MITKIDKKHELPFLDLVKSMWEDRQTYEEHSYEFLDRYWYEDKFYDSDYIFYVSDDSTGKINGLIVGEIHKKDIEVVFLFVRPESRRQNIGTGLKKKLLTYAELLGKNEVIAYNLYTNERVFGMNDRLGQVVEKIDEHYYKSIYVIDKDEWLEENHSK